MKLRIPAFIGLYAVLELPLLGIEVFLRLYLLIFLKDKLNVSIDVVSLLLLCELVLEALFVRRAGHLSDVEVLRGKSRWPLVLAGCLATGLSLLVLFHLPRLFPEINLGAQALGLLLTLVLQLSLAFAWVNYAALTGDLIGKGKAFGLISLRATFGSLAPILCVYITGRFVTEENPEVLTQSAWFFCISLFLVGFASSLSRFLFLPKVSSWSELEGPTPIAYSEHAVPHSKHLPSSLFLLLLAFLLFQVALTIGTSSQMYYLREFQNFEPAQIQNAIVAFSVTMAIAIPLWALVFHFLRRKISLYALLVPAGILASIPMFTAFLWLKPNYVMAIQFWVLGWTAFFTAPFFLMEYLLFRLGFQSKKIGETYGLWWIPLRLGRSLGMVAVGLLLGWSGLSDFDPRAADRIAFLHGPVTAGLLLTATLLLISAWVFSKRGTSGRRPLSIKA